MTTRNAFYAQSGGVTAVINASACGVIQTARAFPDRIGTVYAGRNGIIGALQEELIDTAEESLRAGIAQMVEGNRLSDIGHAVEQVVDGAGYGTVREYTGHAIGTAMHESPQVPNFGPPDKGPRLKVGNVFAIEPMLNMGGEETRVLDDGWAVVTADGTVSAHVEHTIAITDDGPEVFTRSSFR